MKIYPSSFDISSELKSRAASVQLNRIRWVINQKRKQQQQQQQQQEKESKDDEDNAYSNAGSWPSNGRHDVEKTGLLVLEPHREPVHGEHNGRSSALHSGTGKQEIQY